MARHSGTGVLVAFEGIDGAGKTTQVDLLVSALLRIGEPTTRSKEPTNGSWGIKIRESSVDGRLRKWEELKFFLRDREQHANAVVRPALKRGEVVILDRYYYSTIAYQGVRGFDVKRLHSMMERRFLIPDAVFLLDIDPELSLFRIRKRGDIPNEFERLNNLQESRKIFNHLKDKVVIHIDGGMSIEAVHNQVLERFVDGPLKKRRCAKKYGCDDPLYCMYRMSETCPWVKLRYRLMNALVTK